MHKLLALFLCLFVLCGCRAARPLTKSGVAMDTVVSITLYDVQDVLQLQSAQWLPPRSPYGSARCPFPVDIGS